MASQALLVLLAVFQIPPVFAATFSGTILSIQKNGVLLVEESPSRKHQVRLLGIRRHPGISIREFQKELSTKLEKKKALIMWEALDPLCTKYRKKNCTKLARLFIDNREIGLELISQGIASYNKRDKQFLRNIAGRSYSEAQEQAFLTGLHKKN